MAALLSLGGSASTSTSSVVSSMSERCGVGLPATEINRTLSSVYLSISLNSSAYRFTKEGKPEINNLVIPLSNSYWHEMQTTKTRITKTNV